ncbi:hypothetical protein N8654_03595 [Synechococcus sp. AH-601-B19]|nr:hypothetical protein [Synechococcus sp. AH-601-B19]
MERWRQTAQDSNERPVLILKKQKELEKLCAQKQMADQGSQEGATAQVEIHGGDGSLAGAAKIVEGLLLGGRGRLTSAAKRCNAIELIIEAFNACAGLVNACR